MEKKIKKYSFINLGLIIIIIALGLVQGYFEENEQRKLKAFIGYFLILPMFFLSISLTAQILKYYLGKTLNKDYKFFYLSIPAILLILYFIVVFVMIIIESF